MNTPKDATTREAAGAPSASTSAAGVTELVEWLRNKHCNVWDFPDMHDEAANMIERLQAELAANKARADAMAELAERNDQDARRYQWLRANHEKYDPDESKGQLSLWEHKRGCDYGMKSYAKLDQAIDSTITKEQP